MKGRKGSTDEGGVRSPLFIKWDGKIESGKKIKEITGAIDLLPTLTDLAGIKYTPEKQLDGISLKTLLLNENVDWKERFIFSYWNKKISVRSQKYRFDSEGKLYDMENDPGQNIDVSKDNPEILSQFVIARQNWENEVLAELPKEDNRTFTIGHPNYPLTQVPARDGIPHGNIKRSSIHPNCSFFTNWNSISDSITWEAEVLTDGNYEVEIYYTCAPEDVGSTFEISFRGEKLNGKISEAHNPPLTGMENDRDPRTESYVKDFKPIKVGTIHLKKGEGTLTIKPIEISGSNVMDFRLMMLRRI
jgi:hypothetical protein